MAKICAMMPCMGRVQEGERMDVPYCPYCGAKDPGDSGWKCGAGRQVPTKVVNTVDWERLLDLKEDLATPGRLTGRELRETRTEYVNMLRVSAARNNTGHEIPRPEHR